MSMHQRAVVAKFYKVGIGDVNRLTKKEIERQYQMIVNYYKSEDIDDMEEGGIYKPPKKKEIEEGGIYPPPKKKNNLKTYNNNQTKKMGYTQEEIEKYTNIIKKLWKKRQDKIKNQKQNKSNCRLVFLDCTKKEAKEKIKSIENEIRNKIYKKEQEDEFEEHTPGLLLNKKTGAIIPKIDHSANYSDYQRTHLKKKSAYERKYHLEKKLMKQLINLISILKEKQLTNFIKFFIILMMIKLLIQWEKNLNVEDLLI